MMGGSVPAADVWRPASIEALADLMGLLRVVSDPKKAKVALDRIAEAQASFDAREKAFGTEQERLAELNALVMQRKVDADAVMAAAQTKFQDAAKAECEWSARRDELDGHRAVFHGEKKKHAAEVERWREVHDARAKSLEAQESAIARNVGAVAAREERATAREKAVEAREADIAARHARLTEALKG